METHEFLPESRLKILSRRYRTPLSTSSETATDDIDGVDITSPVLLVAVAHLFPGELSILSASTD